MHFADDAGGDEPLVGSGAVPSMAAKQVAALQICVAQLGESADLGHGAAITS